MLSIESFLRGINNALNKLLVDEFFNVFAIGIRRNCGCDEDEQEFVKSFLLKCDENALKSGDK